ncbi:MAG: neutral/alkaline non-lysosomal ceramidase N-terminal domain-containing protein [Planctomycetaceae bacterium]
MKPYFWTLFVALNLLVGTPASLFADSPLLIGIAETDITPPEGFPMAGYYHERLAKGARDPLKARAFVFMQGDTRAALVTCDLTGIAYDLASHVRNLAESKTGIPAEHIVLTASHSHTAPDYGRDLFDGLAELKNGTPAASTRYSNQLIDKLVEVISTAKASARPVKIDAGSAEQKIPVSFNRRFVMKDGSVKTWMTLDNPNVVRAAGPIDREIGIIVIRDADGDQPLGTLTNFALHLDTVGGDLWSADYPYYIEQNIQNALGKNVISLFGTGCCGDINHVNPALKDRNKTDYIGNALGETIVSALPGLSRVENPRFRVRSAVVSLPLTEVSTAQAHHSRDVIAASRKGEQVEFFEMVTAYKSIMIDQFLHQKPEKPASDYINWGLSHQLAGIGEQIPVHVQAMSLGGDVAIVTLPGEVFVELGLAIKQASPFKHTHVIELSNAVETIYIPTRAAYAGGSYEVTNSAVQPGSGEMLAETAIRLLREIAEEESAAAQ